MGIFPRKYQKVAPIRKKIVTQFRSITVGGKRFVASKFTTCLEGVAESFESVPQNMRYISRDNHTWYVYGDERTFMDDINARTRTRWIALVHFEILP